MIDKQTLNHEFATDGVLIQMTAALEIRRARCEQRKADYLKTVKEKRAERSKLKHTRMRISQSISRLSASIKYNNKKAADVYRKKHVKSIVQSIVKLIASRKEHIRQRLLKTAKKELEHDFTKQWYEITTPTPAPPVVPPQGQ